ncbi:MAG: type II toxin-antitoxin system PemK/MazF family toxin [Campylobacterota bacterium]|nr:type II toxin-antitoxin system PemK/MazF family toxin [Campylobacterota bacterium]
MKMDIIDTNGLVLLDQIRAVDKTRIVKKIGKVEINKSIEISKILIEIFEY